MALWVVRVGKRGEYEGRIVGSSQIFVSWGLPTDIRTLTSREQLVDLLQAQDPNAALKRHINQAQQLWAFTHAMEVGDWVLIPLKSRRVFHIAEIASDYDIDTKDPDGIYHRREISWILKDIPRATLDLDLRRSISASQTVFQVSRNNAETRVHELVANQGKPVDTHTPTSTEVQEDIEGVDADLETIAGDAIEDLLIEKFPRGEMESLVEALLEAQGYTVYHSPTGPDGGVDLLAAPGPFGFGSPRLCIQVKGGNSPVGASVLRDLGGTMQNVQAEQGLLVSWGGFTSEVERQRATQFFSIRLWDRTDLIRELLESYESLDDKFKAELPLKQIWIVASESD